MNTSPSIAAIAKAFAAAQLELENVTKDKTNPAFKSQYATLAAVLDVVRPVMAKHGIAIIQAPGNNDAGQVTVTTTLAHESGEWMSSCVIVPTPKNDAQGVGSAISYGRRYSLAAMCGVAQEDDDGNAASAPQTPANARSQPATAPRATTPATAQPRALDKTEREIQDARDYCESRIGLLAGMWNGKQITADAIQNRVPPAVLKDILAAIKEIEAHNTNPSAADYVDQPFFPGEGDMPA